jgi:uncharacterized protein (TIGR04255 family)
MGLSQTSVLVDNSCPDNTTGESAPEWALPAHPSYPNPQIAEAVCEFRFSLQPGAPWQATSLGELFKVLQPTYPQLEPVTEQSVELIIAPDGIPVQKMGASRVRFKMRHASQPFILMITEGVFNVNALAPYPGWATFKAELEAVWPHFIHVINPAALHQIGMRYINRIPRSTDDESAGMWLRESDYVPRAVLGSGPGYVARVEVQADALNRRMITIAHDVSSQPGALIFDIDCVWKHDAASAWNDVDPELERLHENVWEIFNEAKAEKLDELLSRRTD